MLYNVDTRSIHPARFSAYSIQTAELQAESAGEGADIGKMDFVLGWYEDVDSLWVDWEGRVAARNEASPPLVMPQETVLLPTLDAVSSERDRRLELGFDHDFGDARGVQRFGSTETDMKRWLEVSIWAMAQLMAGNISAWIIVNNALGEEVAIIPSEWMSVINDAGLYRDSVWDAARALSAMDPIPLDYASDERWAN